MMQGYLGIYTQISFFYVSRETFFMVSAYDKSERYG